MVILLRMKLDNSLGGRELKLGLRVNGQDPATDWWENGGTVQRTIRNAPNDVLSYIGLGLADDQIRIKFTVDGLYMECSFRKNNCYITV